MEASPNTQLSLSLHFIYHPFNQVKCIKDEREHLLVKEDEIQHRWQEYFDKLFNGENTDTTFQLNDSYDDTNRRFVWRIQESKVREALKRMKWGKTMGPDGIPIKVWRCLGDIAIVWLTKLFNHIFWSNKMPDEWKSILVPIYKNKGDIQSYTNYRGIKLMSHTMKLWESSSSTCEERRRYQQTNLVSCPKGQPWKLFS